MKYRCRCRNSACRARKTLKKHPANYIRPPKCWKCGGNEWTLDLYRQRRGSKDLPEVCACLGRILPHRYGQKGCAHREDYLIDMSMRGSSKKVDFCLF